MLVYRIALAKYALSLKASGRAARWNPNKVEVIYTSSSRSLACLENVVHRNQFGLNQAFSVMIISIPGKIKTSSITLANLPFDWKEFDQMLYTQRLGQEWADKKETAVLQVPSSIIGSEHNYLINPLHPDFELIRLVEVESFDFDKRIKSGF